MLLWLVLTSGFGLMGMSLAAFYDGLEVKGALVSGNIDLVFVSASGVPSDRGSVAIANGGKHLSISIEQAQPGESFAIDYTVKNGGSIPVKFNLQSFSPVEDEMLEVENSLPDNELGPGDEVSGRLTVLIRDIDSIEELTYYPFAVSLEFRQWNMVD